MSMNSGQILIVEDEVNIRTGLRDILSKDGHTVLDVGSGEEALVILPIKSYDVAIVDIRMPGMSGIELLEKIRTEWEHLAVIILTGHGDLESARVAVRAGAYDYLLKPAMADNIRQIVKEAVAASRQKKAQAQLLQSLRVGLSQIDDVLATGQNETLPPSEQHVLEFGDLRIDTRTYEVHQNGETIHLTPTEFKLLVALGRHPDEVVDYNTLAYLALGYEAELWEAKELTKRHVSAIRQKIELDPASPRYLLNVRGVGYRLTAPVEA